MIDHIALLKRFLAHLNEVEGYDFIDGDMTLAGFSDEEADLLNRLSLEAIDERMRAVQAKADC